MTDQLGVLGTNARPLTPLAPSDRSGRPVAAVPSTRSRPWSKPRRWLALVAAGIAGTIVTATLGLLIEDAVTQHRQAERVQTSLSSTNRMAARVSADLDVVQHDLGALTTQVGSDSTALDQDAAQLQGAQAALKAAQAHVFLQGSQAVTMHTCLSGVQQALNALAVGNQPDALWMLTLVSSDCSAAAASGA